MPRQARFGTLVDAGKCCGREMAQAVRIPCHRLANRRQSVLPVPQEKSIVPPRKVGHIGKLGSKVCVK